MDEIGLPIAGAVIPSLAGIFILRRRSGGAIPESLWLAFIAGAATAVVAAILERLLLRLGVGGRFFFIPAAFMDAFVIAALSEEIVKALCFYSFAAKMAEVPARALVFAGLAVALGFAAAENVVYGIYGAERGLTIAALRHFSAVPCHALNGVIFALYFAEHRATGDPMKVLKGLAVVCFFHGIYDYLIFRHLGFYPLLLVVLVGQALLAKSKYDTAPISAV